MVTLPEVDKDEPLQAVARRRAECHQSNEVSVGYQLLLQRLHIVNTILDHYGSDGLVGKKFQVKYPIRWATGEEDNHPYYFAAVALKFDAPAIFKEVPET